MQGQPAEIVRVGPGSAGSCNLFTVRDGQLWHVMLAPTTTGCTLTPAEIESSWLDFCQSYGILNGKASARQGPVARAALAERAPMAPMTEPQIGSGYTELSVGARNSQSARQATDGIVSRQAGGEQMSEAVLRVNRLRKVYGDFVAVDDVDLLVNRGEIFGLLGPNGAGKTSALECLEGIRKPDGGTIDILGVDPTRQPHKLRDLVGVQLQLAGLPESMQVQEAMRFFCAYHHVAPRDSLLLRMGLQDKLRTQYHELSVGQQRRLALALAIAHQPALVFLDEPTAGLDVASRAELHSILQELRAEGVTIVLATHDMAEAEKLADRVSILLRGRVVACGTPHELTAAGKGLTKVSVRTERALLTGSAVEFPAVSQRLTKDDYAVYYSADPGPTVAAILAYVQAQDDRLIDLRVERPSLEERFLEITDDGGAA